MRSCYRFFGGMLFERWGCFVSGVSIMCSALRFCDLVFVGFDLFAG